MNHRWQNMQLEDKKAKSSTKEKDQQKELWTKRGG